MSRTFPHPLFQPGRKSGAGTLFAVLLMVCAWSGLTSAQAAPHSALPSVAFYYGQNPPINALQGFDWIVVDGNARLPTPVSGLGP